MCARKRSSGPSEPLRARARSLRERQFLLIPSNLRIGLGFDVHPFVSGRPLKLGGVAIPHSVGLAGHSDADVLLHAIADAVLGSVADGDIGRHFPPGDPSTRDMDSFDLLRQVRDRLALKGARVVNIDAVVIAEAPRIAPYVDMMRARIGEALGISADSVSVKGTTSERLGFTGRGEGIAAQAVCLVALPASS